MYISVILRKRRVAEKEKNRKILDKSEDDLKRR
jgi:hypothetical protein